VLAEDIGTALGGGAHIGLLRRTRIGSFGEGDMRPLDLLTRDAILTPAQALRDLAFVTVEAEIAVLIGRGLPLDRVPIGAAGDGPWAMLDRDGNLLAVYEGTDTDRIKPAVVMTGS
jgi:tRNA pseudouridine55 synthase